MALYVWQVLDADGWGTIAAELPGLGTVPLVTRSAIHADILGFFAIAHHDATGLPVRKVRFELAQVLREIP